MRTASVDKMRYLSFNRIGFSITFVMRSTRKRKKLASKRKHEIQGKTV